MLGDITVDVVQKDIKNVHLSVYPPTGRVRIAAPLRMNLDTIRIYAISKLSWIKQQQTKFREQPRETPREYLNKEGHYYLGKRYLLTIIERDAPPQIKLRHSTIELYVRPDTEAQKRKDILESWYRERLKELAPSIIEKWEDKMSVSLNEFQVKKMKTKWGTCNCDAKNMLGNYLWSISQIRCSMI